MQSFQIYCLKTLGEVDYTNLLPHIEALPQNRLRRKCRNFVKNYFLACKKSHTHLQYAYNICVKSQIDCVRTLSLLRKLATLC